MALSLRGTAGTGGNQGATTATSQAITLPTGATTNDIVYFVVSVGAVVSSPTATGWTLVLTTDATGATSTIVGYRTLVSGDTGPTVSWTTAGRVAWTAVALQPGAGNSATHSLWATPNNTGTAATSKTPPATTAVAGNASVILTGSRPSATATTAVTMTPSTNWTEPTNGDQSTTSGTAARQTGAHLAYRVGLTTGAVTPSAETLSVSSFAIVSHALVAEQAIPAISTLTSTFDTTIPSFFDDNFGGISVTGGQLSLPVVGTYSGAQTLESYNATGSSTYAKITLQHPISGTFETFFEWVIDSSNSVQMFVSGGTFTGRVRKAAANTNTNLNGGVYSSTSHAWWRIREASGSVFFDTSPDGTTWTNLGSLAHTLTLTAAKLVINTGFFGAETQPGDTLVDNLNVTPVALARRPLLTPSQAIVRASFY